MRVPCSSTNNDTILAVFLLISAASGFLSPFGNGGRGVPPTKFQAVGLPQPDDGSSSGTATTLYSFPMEDLPGWNATCLLFLTRGGGDGRGGRRRRQTDPLLSALNYWKNALATASSKVFLSPLRKIRFPSFKSQAQREHEAVMEKIKTIPIERVVVPNTTVLPDDVIQIAAQRSGILGRPLTSDSVQALVSLLGLWYSKKGYVMHHVSGVQVDPESATAEISVEEPISSLIDPVVLTTMKEMVEDEENGGQRISPRQYLIRRAQRGKPMKMKDIPKENMTLVETTGRTKSHRIAAALGIEPGAPFRVEERRWKKVTESGLFAQLYQVSPLLTQDGVQLHMVVSEAPPKNLEYGVGKSLYSGSWEGEVDFQHSNLLGGGETLGVVMRRGPKDSLPSIRCKFSEGRLDLVGGYDVEAFLENIPDTRASLSRRGATLRVQNPISQDLIPNAICGVSVEQTTNGDALETIASTNMEVGPMYQVLPLGARSNVDASMTIGTRVPRRESIVLPYFTAGATSRQLFPLFSTSKESERPFIFALRHSVVASSDSIPIHISKTIGSTMRIRGAKVGRELTHAFRGTTEFRMPISLPRSFTKEQDSSIVVFGDWLLAKMNSQSAVDSNACVGIGLRKTFQGLPLQFDITYSKSGQVRCTMGLGSDFFF